MSPGVLADSASIVLSCCHVMCCAMHGQKAEIQYQPQLDLTEAAASVSQCQAALIYAAGGVVGGLVALGLVVGLAAIVVARRRRKQPGFVVGHCPSAHP